MTDFAEIFWWVLFGGILWDDLRARAFGGRTFVVEIFRQIRITKAEVCLGLSVGFFPLMFFLMVGHLTPSGAQVWFNGALVCAIAPLIAFGGKLANWLQRLFSKEISPTNSLIFRKPTEKIKPHFCKSFRSKIHRPDPPPPRSTLA